MRGAACRQLVSPLQRALRVAGGLAAAGLLAAASWTMVEPSSDAPEDHRVDGGAIAGGPVDDRGGGDDAGVDAALTRAIEASTGTPHGGALTVVSFGETGPRVSEFHVARDADAVRLAHTGDGGFEVGRVGGQAFLRSSDQLLRLGGVEPSLAQLDRLRVKYEARLGDDVVLDTGLATALHLIERATGVLRENLYLDDTTGLIVRRETFGADGQPVRLVAYTDLHAAPSLVEVPPVEGIEVRDHDFVAADVDDLIAGGRTIPRELPGGFELLAAAEVDSSTPAVHLLYGDGLYSLSLFQQDGRMARTAVRGAAELTTSDGGSVWRWPGSEPRRVVWTGGGRTFTVLTDAPIDELLDAITGLPVDPAPSILDRLHRGITRAADWLTPGDGSTP